MRAPIASSSSCDSPPLALMFEGQLGRSISSISSIFEIVYLIFFARAFSLAFNLASPGSHWRGAYFTDHGDHFLVFYSVFPWFLCCFFFSLSLVDFDSNLCLRQRERENPPLPRWLNPARCVLV